MPSLRPPAWIALALVVASTAIAVPVRAQKSDAALAEALFQEGRRLLQRKKTDEACPKFEESYRLAPKLGTLLNLATCHDQQGRTGSAWGELTEAITMAKEAGETERVTYARKLLDDLETRLSRLVVEVPKPVAGQEVRIDGELIGAAAYRTPLPLDPGDHVVEARAPGHEPWTKTVTIGKGPSRVSVEVPPLAVVADEGPAPTPAPPPPSPTPPPQPESAEGGSTGQLVAGLVVGGVGLVGLGLGSAFGLMTFSSQDESEAHCVESRCDATGVELREDASTSATLSTVAFVAGGVLVAGGLVLVLTSGGGDGPATTAQLSPVATPGGAGLILAGSLR